MLGCNGHVNRLYHDVHRHWSESFFQHVPSGWNIVTVQSFKNKHLRARAYNLEDNSVAALDYTIRSIHCSGGVNPNDD